MTRTLNDALKTAHRIRAELPFYIQPGQADIDIVILADEVLRLQDEIEQIYLDAAGEDA